MCTQAKEEIIVYRHLGLVGCNISYRGYWNWNC